MSQLKEDLKALRTLLTPQQAWQQGRLSNVPEEDPLDAEATCWCLVGAAAKTTGDRDPYIRKEQSPRFKDVIGALVGGVKHFSSYTPTNDMSTVYMWNDQRNRDHDQVLALIDYAIQAAA